MSRFSSSFSSKASYRVREKKKKYKLREILNLFFFLILDFFVVVWLNSSISLSSFLSLLSSLSSLSSLVSRSIAHTSDAARGYRWCPTNVTRDNIQPSSIDQSNPMLETCKLKPWWGPPIATGNMNILQMWHRYVIL